MLMQERYGTAINAGNLVVNPRTSASATDVLAASASATRARPLAASLLRWFSGDRRALPDLASISTQMLTTKAWHLSKLKLRKPVAQRIVGDVLVWYWVRVCAFCVGRGYALVPGAPYLSDVVCPACDGRGRISTVVDFGRHKTLALWLASEYEREHSLAISKMSLAIRSNSR